MQKYFLSVLFITAAFGSQLNAQATNSLNSSIMIVTDMEGNTMMQTSIDGASRRNYIPAKVSGESETMAVAGVQEIEPSYVSLYPSAATDVLFFDGTKYDTFVANILDFNGAIMASVTYGLRGSVDISSLENGTYLIEVTSTKTGKVYHRKIVKE